MKEIKTNDGKKGGLLKGKPHYDKQGNSLGGIKAVVTDAGGKPVELEGGEVIINKEASKKHWKLLSKINQSAGGGVPIGPPSGADVDEDPEEFKEGGRIIEFNPNHLPNKWVVQYAEKIKKEHPEIWKLGGNIFGNEAFENLLRVSKRGHWLDSEEWMYVKWRSYVARHKGDFRIEGVVAMLKWCDKVEKGWAYMKDLIDEKIDKIEFKKEKASLKMSTGGKTEFYGVSSEDEKKSAIAEDRLKYFGSQKLFNNGEAFKNNLKENYLKKPLFDIFDTRTVIIPGNYKRLVFKLKDDISKEKLNEIFKPIIEKFNKVNFVDLKISDFTGNSFVIEFFEKSTSKMATGGGVEKQNETSKSLREKYRKLWRSLEENDLDVLLNYDYAFEEAGDVLGNPEMLQDEYKNWLKNKGYSSNNSWKYEKTFLSQPEIAKKLRAAFSEKNKLANQEMKNIEKQLFSMHPVLAKVNKEFDDYTGGPILAQKVYKSGKSWTVVVPDYDVRDVYLSSEQVDDLKKYIKESTSNSKMATGGSVDKQTTGNKILDKLGKLLKQTKGTIEITPNQVRSVNGKFAFSGPTTLFVKKTPSNDYYFLMTNKGTFRVDEKEVKKAEDLYDELESIIQAGKTKRAVECDLFGNPIMSKGGELAKGIRAEREHQKTIDKIYDRKVSKSKAPELIAKDHLKEDKKYYSKLEKMEGKKFGDGGSIENAMTLNELQKSFYYGKDFQWNDFPKFITHNGVTYEKGTFKTQTGLKQGQYILSYYTRFNRGTDFWRLEKFIVQDKDDEIVKKFDTQSEMLKEYKAKSIEELDDVLYKQNESSIRILTTYFSEEPDYDNNLDAWLYEYENKWVRGSGAEKVTFIEYIPLNDKMQTNEPTQNPQTSSNNTDDYEIGEEGDWNGRTKTRIKITKVTPKSVYYLDYSDNKEKFDTKEKFSRLFVSDKPKSQPEPTQPTTPVTSEPAQTKFKAGDIVEWKEDLQPIYTAKKGDKAKVVKILPEGEQDLYIEWISNTTQNNGWYDSSKFVKSSEPTQTSSIQNTFGLKIGDNLPQEIINKWVEEGENYCVESEKKWKIGFGTFTTDRKIESFKIIDGALGFLVSSSVVYLRAEGFKEFLEQQTNKTTSTPEPTQKSSIYENIIIENLEVYYETLGRDNYKNAVDLLNSVGKDWRLPTVDEFNKILYPNKSKLPGINEDDFYWTSIEHPVNNKLVYLVDFENGKVYSSGEKKDKYYLLAVKDVKQQTTQIPEPTQTTQTTSNTTQQKGLPSTDPETWNGEFKVGDRVKVRWDFSNDLGLPDTQGMARVNYFSSDNAYTITKKDTKTYAKFLEKGGLQRPQNPSGYLYRLNNEQDWEGKDLELISTTNTQTTQTPQKTQKLPGTGEPISVNLDTIEVFRFGLGYNDWDEVQNELKKLSETFGEGWRLPTVDECEYIIEPNMDKISYLQIADNLKQAFWTSTETNTPATIKAFDFEAGTWGTGFKPTDYFNTIAVRDINKQTTQEPQQTQQQKPTPKKQKQVEPKKRPFNADADFVKIFQEHLTKENKTVREISEKQLQQKIVNDFIIATKDVAGFDKEKLKQINSYFE